MAKFKPMGKKKEIKVAKPIHLRSPDNSTSVLCVLRVRRYANDNIRDLLFKCFTSKLGIEQMNKVPGKFEIYNLLVDVLNVLCKKVLAYFTITALV